MSLGIFRHYTLPWLHISTGSLTCLWRMIGSIRPLWGTYHHMCFTDSDEPAQNHSHGYMYVVVKGP